MNRPVFYSLGSLLLLLCCSTTHGQGCATTLVPHFAVYHSVARDGYTIYTTSSIQGYASVYPNPGCNMNSATHRVRAGNTIGGVGGSVYSSPGCPNCYFSVSNAQEIVGVPGVLYPWAWDGSSICSLVGSFWNSSGGGGSLPGCLVPASETTVDKGFSGAISRELFQMTLNDNAGDSFDSSLQVKNIHEVTAATGTNSCYWLGSGLVQNPGVYGTNWSVGYFNNAAGYHNQWGPDAIGWDLSVLDKIVNEGPAHGITFPCVTTIHQGMQIMCNAATWWQYRTDDIQISVDDDKTEESCRAGVCSEWVDFAYRVGGRSMWWARLWRDHRHDFSAAEEAKNQ